MFNKLQPNFGASLHILKVEIGGDAQSSGLTLHFSTLFFFFKANLANSQASTQTLSRRGHNGFNGLAGSEGILKRNCVSPSKCHGQLLKQIRRLLWIASDDDGAFSNLLDQFDRLVVPGTRRLNGHWIKHMGPRPTQPSIPLGSVNEYHLRLGRQRQVWFIPLADDRRVCR